MNIGLSYTLRNPPMPKWFTPWPQYYGEALDHIAEMERLGFNSVTFTEHHGDPDGYNPSILLIMTAVAMRTQRIIIGQNILQIPYHHPVRLAEDLATIDILSGGRVMLNAGQAGRPFDDEFRALGLNPTHRPSLTEEGLDIVRKCWTEEVFSYQGKRWNLQDVRVYPKPLQQPYPPMYVVAGSEASMDRAARMGINACGRGGSGKAALGDKEQWETWRDKWHVTLAKYGRKPEDYLVNTHGMCFVTDDPEREWAKHKDAILYGRAYKRHNGTQPYLEATAGWHENYKPQKPEDIPTWETIFRTPEDTVKHLRACFSDSAPDELLVSAERPGIPFADTAIYMRNFAEKVLPHLQDLPLKK